ncbi:MAG: hypothetical protein L0177_20200 [Chloroflexi bacterium]|nr:hypothetical protein [Chloroflexota bacterium]
MSLLLKWSGISLLVLVACFILAILGIYVAAVEIAGPTGGGISLSEWGERYIALALVSAIVGLIALGLAALFWTNVLTFASGVTQSPRKKAMMRVSLAIAPPFTAALFFVLVLFSDASVPRF